METDYFSVTTAWPAQTTLSPPGGPPPETSLLMNLMEQFKYDSLPNASLPSAGGGVDLNHVGAAAAAINVSSIFTSTMASTLVAPSNHVFGDVLFAYTSPFLIFLGLVGNMLSLVVFTFGARSSKVARSQYLLCLGISDSVVLLSYVLPEWLKRGSTTLDPTAKNLANNVYDSWRCYTILFLSYSSRFISAWLRVLFTFERFYSIRFPFKRLTFQTRLTRIFILMTVLSGLLISSLKPPLMQSRLILELNAASTASPTPGYDSYGSSYEIDITSLFTSSPGYSEMSTRQAILAASSLPSSWNSSPQQHFQMTTSVYGDYASVLKNSSWPSAVFSNDVMYDESKPLTTTQVDSRMLQALLHVFGNNPGTASNGMNSSEFIDAMLGEAVPNPICVVRPEFRKYGELYDTLYFGVFIMLLPFLLIIIFDFNVLYVVRHRDGHLFTPISTPSSSMMTPVSRKGTAVTTTNSNPSNSNNLPQHPEFGGNGSNSLNSRGRIMSVVGGNSLVPDKLTVMLVLSSTFILLNLPYFIIWSIYSYFIQPGQATQKAKFTEMPTDIFNNLSFAARTISSLTYSANGIIYFVSDQTFRYDFSCLIRRCWQWRHRSWSKSSSSTRNMSLGGMGGASSHPAQMSSSRFMVSRAASYANSIPRQGSGIARECESLISLSPSNQAGLSKQQQQAEEVQEELRLNLHHKNSNEQTTEVLLHRNGSVLMKKEDNITANNQILTNNSTPERASLSNTHEQGLVRQRSVHFADESRPKLQQTSLFQRSPSLKTNQHHHVTNSANDNDNVVLLLNQSSSLQQPLPTVKQQRDQQTKVKRNNSASQNSSQDGERSSGVSSASSESSVKQADKGPVAGLVSSDATAAATVTHCVDTEQSKTSSSGGGNSSELVIYCELESCI